jgi:uncharacterized protein (TIGR03067 family)
MSGSRLLPLLMFVPLSSLAAAEADDAKALNGVWKGWVVEGRGDDPKQRRMRVEVTIKGDTITAVEDGSKDLGAGTFTLKFTKDGKQLDATRTKGAASKAGTTYLGIYTLEGNTLKWCVGNPPGRDRPTELRSKLGQFLMILTKDK